MSKEVFIPKETEIPGRLRIGVDIDGNVDDIDIWSLRAIRRGLGVRIRTGVPREFYYDKYPEIAQIPGGPVFIKKLFSHAWLYGMAKPIPGAVEILEKWHKQGHQLYFITARREHLRQTTYKWFDENGLGWAKEMIYFREQDRDDRHDFKNETVSHLGVQVLIEDFADTLRTIKSENLMVKVVLRTDWNMAENLGGQARLVNNWEQIDKIIQEASCWHYFLHSR